MWSFSIINLVDNVNRSLISQRYEWKDKFCIVSERILKFLWPHMKSRFDHIDIRIDHIKGKKMIIFKVKLTIQKVNS